MSEVEVTVDTPEETPVAPAVIPVVVSQSDPAVLELAERVGRTEALVMDLQSRTVVAEVTADNAAADAQVAAADAQVAIEVAVAAAEVAAEPPVEEAPVEEPPEDTKPQREHWWYRSREDWRKK